MFVFEDISIYFGEKRRYVLFQLSTVKPMISTFQDITDTLHIELTSQTSAA